MKENFKYVFERIEKKYLIDERKFNILMKDINKYMKEDEYGATTICNIYFDTLDNFLIRKSLEKPDYKEKLRLRSYGIPKNDSTVFLEIKKKYKGIVYKRRVAMRYEDAQKYLKNKIRPNGNNQILNEIDYFINFYKPIPKLFLAYDRMAYVGKDDENLRITFDKNIRSRKDDLELGYSTKGELIVDKNLYLMEIKAYNSLPMWLSHTLSLYEIYPISFSKYGVFYQNELKLKNSSNRKIRMIKKYDQRRKRVCLQAF